MFAVPLCTFCTAGHVPSVRVRIATGRGCKIETVLNNSFQFKIPAHMRNRNRGAHDITGVYDVTCKESFNNVSVQTVGSTSMFLTVSTSFSLRTRRSCPRKRRRQSQRLNHQLRSPRTRVQTRLKTEEPAEEKEAESTEPAGVQESDDKSIASKSAFGCC